MRLDNFPQSGKGVIAEWQESKQNFVIRDYLQSVPSMNGNWTQQGVSCQMKFLIGGYRHQVLMGDMNTHANDLLEHSPLRDLGLLAPQIEATFPSWRPQRCLDHILLSPTLTLERVQVLAQPISDHLPVAVEIRLPDSLRGDSLPVPSGGSLA